MGLKMQVRVRDMDLGKLLLGGQLTQLTLVGVAKAGSAKRHPRVTPTHARPASEELKTPTHLSPTRKTRFIH
jgi:hypothetical protein